MFRVGYDGVNLYKCANPISVSYKPVATDCCTGCSLEEDTASTHLAF